jgi:hypothetical protein
MVCPQIHVHADFESLYKVVPKRLLPEEYGGEAGPLEVLIGECGVRLIWISKFVFYKSKDLSLDPNLQLTQARQISYVVYFDIETQVALKRICHLTPSKPGHMYRKVLNKRQCKVANPTFNSR